MLAAADTPLGSTPLLMRSTPAETVPRGAADPLPKRRYRELLADARRRTLELVATVAGADLDRVHDQLMSPLVWDLGHIALFEDLWLCCRAGGLGLLREDLAPVYDAFETPRAGRGSLPYLRRAPALSLMERVRERALRVLDGADLSPGADPLNAGGFVWEMLILHEQQHNETMLQTLQLARLGTYVPSRTSLPAATVTATPRPATVRVEAGPFVMGAGDGGFAYDNERPQHEVELAAFEIDRTPVTAGAFLEFIADGGYRRREWWSDEGWAWRAAESIERPLYWTADGRCRSYERLEPIDPALPVMNVSWYEADAYARSQGRRLPTEQEWERAASWDADTAAKRRYPWGDASPAPEHANLDATAFSPAPAGAYPAGTAASGALGMIGDVWEWTASEFDGYPGFEAFPYREYSEVSFGAGHKVLRGGSWATRPRVIHCTFRNWDYPQRRQIFVGVRCASDG